MANGNTANLSHTTLDGLDSLVSKTTPIYSHHHHHHHHHGPSNEANLNLMFINADQQYVCAGVIKPDR